MYTIIKEVFLMKVLRINDCRYHFIDNHGKVIFSFKSPSNQPITFLDIRKLQLASMIKGEWCDSFEEITHYLSSLHRTNVFAVGEIVNFFELFQYDSEKLIDTLPIKIEEIISFLTSKSINVTRFSLFLIEGFEKNEILSKPIEEFCPYGQTLKKGEIYFIHDLTNCTKSDLMRIRNIGVGKINEIEKILEENGLHLKEENK